jgi:uncharacterized protein YuzE
MRRYCSYVYVGTPGREIARTVDLGDVWVDIDGDGNVMGVEFLTESFLRPPHDDGSQCDLLSETDIGPQH